MLQKLKSFFRFLRDPSISKWFLVRYSIGQLLSYSGVGKYISFKTPYYKLFLTTSPVAMVLFGNPHEEREEERWLDGILREGDVVIDAGANIGTFSLKAATLVKDSGQVFAFEAHPATVCILRRNIKLNKSRNINITGKALGDRDGFVSFSTEAYDDVNHVVSGEENGFKVPVSKLDDIKEIKNLKKIRCVKIDVEGYELPLLQGAEQTISKAEYVLFEAYAPNCKRFGYTLDELFAWFISRGYVFVDPVTGEKLDILSVGHDTVKNVLALKDDFLEKRAI